MKTRGILVALALAFTAYIAARALLWKPLESIPPLLWLALLTYLVTTWLVLFVPARMVSAPHPDATLTVGAWGPTRLPLWVSILAVISAVVVPVSVELVAGEDTADAYFGGWYFGGVGMILTIVMVRRRRILAWVGVVLLAIISSASTGLNTALGQGLLGAIVWVAVARVVMYLLDRAAMDTVRLVQLQRSTLAWQTTHTTRQRERRVQVHNALAVAGPALTRTVSSAGSLSSAERLTARIAEGKLRDEIRGARLLDENVRRQLDRARRRGATVTVLDEGGLDGVDPDALALIHAELAGVLRGANSDRLYIRASPHPDVAVTVVGRVAAGQGIPEEDAVDLWHEIVRPRDRHV